MMVASSKAGRLRKLNGLSLETRLLLYRRAQDAWRCSLEQREIETGASPMQARVNVAEKHAVTLKQGYTAQAKAERDAFMDRHVAAAMA